MKNKQQIINDSIKLETSPDDYNMIEMYCFLSLKQLLIMFHNKQITTQKATELKHKILAKYDSDSKQFEFERSMFQEHIENIKDTENARIKLHKILNGNGEYARPITEETWKETIKVCIEIIGTVFKGEF